MLMQSSWLGSATFSAATAVLVAWVGIPALGDDGLSTPQIGPTEIPEQTKCGVDDSSLESRLWSAIERGDVTEVQSLVDAGVDVNVEKAVSVEGVSAEELHEVGLRGLTPLVSAALGGHVDVTRTLIDAGANVDAMTIGNDEGGALFEFFGTALMVAVRNGHVGVAQVLIERGADVMLSFKDMSALTEAARLGHLDIVTMLVASSNYEPGTLVGIEAALKTAKTEGHGEVATFLAAKHDEYTQRRAKELHQAAEAGNADAQAELGRMHMYGDGVQEDHKEALRWLHLAAEQGHADAQAQIGMAYSLGKGETKNEAKAGRWFRKAAEQGHADAQFGLGGLYLNGRGGVRQSYVLAHMWLSIAIANGSSQAGLVKRVAEINMTSAQVRRATKRARRCMDSNYESCGR